MFRILLLFLLINFNYTYADDLTECEENIWENLDKRYPDHDYINYVKVVKCETITSPVKNIPNPSNAPLFWNLNLKTADKNFNFRLNKVDSKLFHDDTQIFFGYHPNQNETTNTEFHLKNLYEVAPRLKNVTIYHDALNEYPAALVVFMSNEGIPIVEGFIGSYTLRYVMSKNYYVLYEVSIDSLVNKYTPEQSEKANDFFLRSNIYHNTAYLNILVALDFTFLSKDDSFDILKNIMLYFNAVDMLFSVFQSPKVKINIKGVVIPKSPLAIPYLPEKIGTSLTSHKLGKSYFFNSLYSEIFSTYDTVMVMTGTKFFNYESIMENVWLEREFYLKESNDAIKYETIIRHPDFLGNYFSIAHIISNLFWTNSAGKYYQCNPFFYLEQRNDRGRFAWSKCDVNALSQHFNSQKFSKYYRRTCE